MEQFSQILEKIFPRFPQKIAVAVSGGIDSMALLLLLDEFIKKQKKNSKITVLHVNHQMRPESREDANFVAEFCRKKKISHHILKIPQAEIPEKNIENNLRQARYDLLSDFCQKNKIGFLFLGHHQKDIAENFLIRLFRGSGIDGLAAIKPRQKLKKINLIRPLLGFVKEDLQEFLEQKGIPWREDESNKDEKFLRNKIRNFLNSLEGEEIINKRIALSAEFILESKNIVEKNDKRNFGKIFKQENLGYFRVNLEKFNKIDDGQALRYLTRSLMQISGAIYKPRMEKLEALYEKITTSSIGSAHSFYGCILEKLDEKNLIIYRERAAITEQKLSANCIFDNHLQISLNGKFSAKFTRNLLDSNIKQKLPNSLLKKDNIIITTLDATKFNQIAAKIPILKNYKNPLKKVFYSLPILKEINAKSDKIVAFPAIGFFDLS